MSDEFDDILDGLFHGCALAAFIEQAEYQQGWPDSEATKQRANRLYEAALAAKVGRRTTATDESSHLPLIALEAERQSRLSVRHETEAQALAFIDHAAETGAEP